MLPCSVLTSSPPHGIVPPDPGPGHTVPPLGYSRLLTFHICLLFRQLVKLLANTLQFNTSCKDYNSINQNSHQSTRTTGPQGGRGANRDHAQGAEGEERRWSTYIYVYGTRALGRPCTVVENNVLLWGEVGGVGVG